MPEKYSIINETVSAIQYVGDNKQVILDLAGSNVKTSQDQESIMVKTPLGSIYVLVGDWVVKKPDGQFHIIRKDEFHEMYELSETAIKTTEPTQDQAKRMIGDIRIIQNELRLTLTHLIEYEKVLMFILADFENNMKDQE